MTAELVVMNRQAVALAADSAVTVQAGVTGKAFNTANKLFALSKYHPVGVMVFGGATLMGVPWETVLKLHREHLRDKEFDTLEEYADSLITYLDQPGPFFPPEQQKAALHSICRGVSGGARKELDSRVDASLAAGPLTPAVVSQMLDAVLDESISELRTKRAPLVHLPIDFGTKLVAAASAELEPTVHAVFQNHTLAAAQVSKLLTMVGETIQRDVFPARQTGIVVAGFGKTDYFPKFTAFSVAEAVGDRLRYRRDASVAITVDRNAIISPFAQSDEIKAYIEGIDPSLHSEIRSFMSIIEQHLPDAVVSGAGLPPPIEAQVRQLLETASSALFAGFFQAFDKYRKTEHIDAHIATLNFLSKDQLAEFSETLVSLTSFRRQFSMDLNSVGGPIDVAVISKGDGFIWIKRKHYFKPELNPLFFQNYRR